MDNLFIFAHQIAQEHIGFYFSREVFTFQPFDLLLGRLQFLLPGHELGVFFPARQAQVSDDAGRVALFRVTRTIGELAAGIIAVFTFAPAFFFAPGIGFLHWSYLHSRPGTSLRSIKRKRFTIDSTRFSPKWKAHLLRYLAQIRAPGDRIALQVANTC